MADCMMMADGDGDEFRAPDKVWGIGFRLGSEGVQGRVKGRGMREGKDVYYSVQERIG